MHSLFVSLYVCVCAHIYICSVHVVVCLCMYTVCVCLYMCACGVEGVWEGGGGAMNPLERLFFSMPSES